MVDEKGVSSVIAFLLVISAFFGTMSYVLIHKEREARATAQGLIEAMRKAEKRQEQLLSVTYVQENLSIDVLDAYIYNYGQRKAEVDKLWVDGNEVDPADLSFLDMDGDSTDNGIPSHKLIDIRVEDVSSYTSGSDNYALVFLTESDALYSYYVRRGG